MSKLEAAEPAVVLSDAAHILQAGIECPDSIDNDAFRALFAITLRVYAAKAERGMRTPLPPDQGGLTITDAMLAATDLLHALNVQLFELSMWQAMSGNCIAPHQRVDARDTFPEKASNISSSNL